ncbi:hypothetical protein DPMN_000123 [Dreissena polymorpha]|uniref:Uncharacterized protein n=1 Tax=Dreissena polymorpha TaxID=45954 RepID=A0A9D4RPN2_DREPO|nr:hypothetical protein DPMN_000123 [Dreissena polymorpha]
MDGINKEVAFHQDSHKEERQIRKRKHHHKQTVKNDQACVHHASMDISPQYNGDNAIYDGDNEIITRYYWDKSSDQVSLLTKFHEDRKINVASRVLTRKNAPPPGSHFHEDQTVNVASRPFREKCPAPWPLGSHVFQANIIIFELIQDIIETNLLTKFHEDWTINVAYRPYMEKCSAPGGHVFKATKTIFELLIQDIIGTNLLTKFTDDRKINVTSRVLTRKNAPPPWWPYIIGMNLLTEFHEDQTINVASRVKNAPPLGSHVFQAKVTIFKLILDIIGKNLLTKFHENRKINVASRVLTRKNAPPPGGHIFQPTGIFFKLVQDY